MDAKLFRLAAFVVCGLLPAPVTAASHATANFVVVAPSEEIAAQVAKAAEYWRHELALAWLGRGLPNWSSPCRVHVSVGQIGAGGSTTFTFERGEVFGWNMRVQGTLERILDSVIPHEVNHTIFASHFRRPLPRWADEGAATLIEHESERARQEALLNQVIHTDRKIPLASLLSMREYPSDMQQVLALYAEGYSLADFLIQKQGDDGRARYLKFLADAEVMGWPRAINKHYGFADIAQLENRWIDWVMAGSPRLDGSGNLLFVDAAQQGMKSAAADDDVVVRSQSPKGIQTALAETEPAPLPMIPRRLRDPGDDSALAAPRPTGTSPREAFWISDDPVSHSRSRREEGYRSESSLPDDPEPPVNGLFRRRIREIDISELGVGG